MGVERCRRDLKGKSTGGRLARALLASAAIALFIASDPAAAQTPPPTPDTRQWGLELIGAPAAWAAGFSGAGATVAVADTGIDVTHPALAPKIDFLQSRNFRLPSPDAPYVQGQIGELDANGHGTHVAGIVAAAGTSQAPGVAYDARLAVLRVLKGFDDLDEFPNGASAAALSYFATLPNNVRIYNASYGPDIQTPGHLSWPSWTINADEEQALLQALRAGKIVVAANDNDREPNPIAGRNPSGLALYPFIQPANAKAGVYDDDGKNFNFSELLRQRGLVIGVTAIGENKRIASYAQFCGVAASWCVAAPGGNTPFDDGIWSTLPGGTYGYSEGTSMAAPMVSGALAVLQQAYPNYDAYDLARVLFATAENIDGQAAVNAMYGYGLIRLDRAVAGPTALAGGASVDVGPQQMTYWSRPLVTDGGFAKTGPGYLIIAGRTTATGDATVSAGALGVDGTLTLGTRLTVAEGAMLAGFGIINGTVAINGILNAGQLPNYGDLIANNGGVMPAGIPLTGTSPGTLTFNGNVALGATATTRVNVDGNLQIPGGPRTYDKIVAEGAGHSFAIDGTLMPVLRAIPGGSNDFTPALGSSFAFLTALDGASLTGGFTGLTQPSQGLAPNTRFDVLYAQTVVALYTTPASYQAFAATQSLNANQQSLGNALDLVRPAAGLRLPANVAPLFSLLYPMDATGIDAALVSLSGQGLAATPGVVLNAFSGFSDLLADRQAMLLAGAGGIQTALMPSVAFAYASTGPVAEARAAEPGSGRVSPACSRASSDALCARTSEELPRWPLASLASAARAAEIPFPVKSPTVTQPYGQWSAWGQGYGRWSRVGGADGLPGSSSNSGGFVLGVDRMLSPAMFAGAALGYTRTSTTSADTSGTIDTYAAGVYTTWMPGRFVFDGRLAVGPAKAGTLRSVTFPSATPLASASMSGWGALVAGEAGYRFQVAGGTLKPYVGMTAQRFDQNSFRENAVFSLNVPTQTYNRVTSALGLWATTTFQSLGMTFMPQAKVAWTHDLRDDALVTSAALLEAPFTISAAPPGRDAAVVGLRLAAWERENVRGFVGYSGEFRRNAASHELEAGLRVSW
jgi:autotransporter-associated beta strand protein